MAPPADASSYLIGFSQMKITTNSEQLKWEKSDDYDHHLGKFLDTSMGDPIHEWFGPPRLGAHIIMCSL